MIKNIFLVAGLMIFHLVGVAQKITKPVFTSITQVGIGWGATGEALQLQSIYGVSFATYSVGIGIGLDYYWERTVPLFIDLRKNIFSNKETPFVYADLGINMPWVKADKENTWSKSNYEHGRYIDIGIGYKIPVNKKLFAIVSFGYSQKRLHEKRTNDVIIFDFPYGGNNAENYEYTLRRLSLKGGLSF